MTVQDKGDYIKCTATLLPGGVEHPDDKMAMFLQGSTQIDVLGHVRNDGHLSNGYVAVTATKGGRKQASILPIAERGKVGRGFLDMAAHFVKSALEKGDTICTERPTLACEATGARICYSRGMATR